MWATSLNRAGPKRMGFDLRSARGGRLPGSRGFVATLSVPAMRVVGDLLAEGLFYAMFFSLVGMALIDLSY